MVKVILLTWIFTIGSPLFAGAKEELKGKINLLEWIYVDKNVLNQVLSELKSKKKLSPSQFDQLKTRVDKMDDDACQKLKNTFMGLLQTDEGKKRLKGFKKKENFQKLLDEIDSISKPGAGPKAAITKTATKAAKVN